MHELITTLCAPTVALCEKGGQIRPGGVQGIYHADVRALSVAMLLVADEEPVPLADDEHTTSATHHCVSAALGGPGRDRSVRVRRKRVVTADSVAEQITLISATDGPVATSVRLLVASDLADLQLVRRGAETVAVEPRLVDGGLTWERGGVATRFEAPGADVRDGEASWQVSIAAGESVTVSWRLSITDGDRVVVPAEAPWGTPRVAAADLRLPRLVHRSVDDLEALPLATAARTDDVFLAAGAPWYFTLFGRDSLWTARMLLPLGTTLAAGTLRALAGYQGVRHDPATDEAPGKIMHELRRVAVDLDGRGGVVLPPVYYGTVDATMLWILLLHDAWRWGMPASEVEALLPSLRAALDWLLDEADADGDGLVEYIDSSGRGLANQGWKDSPDAVRFRDGSIASPPIALAEVQGYAYEAALGGAALLDAFGREGGDRARRYAADLAAAFRARFWVDGFPAIALDGEKRPVDSVTSNPGHLLGTGLLDADESSLVAQRLVAPDVSAGYGLRTMSAGESGYAPMSYHRGSVWPHDTAIVALGMMRAGHGREARVLVDGLLAAAEPFAYRLPELFTGDGADETTTPVPYPTSCRPQAWSAGAAVTMLQVLLGLDVDVPAGVLRLSPAPVDLRVENLTIAGERVTIETFADGSPPSVIGTPLEVRVGGARK